MSTRVLIQDNKCEPILKSVAPKVETELKVQHCTVRIVTLYNTGTLHNVIVWNE